MEDFRNLRRLEGDGDVGEEEEKVSAALRPTPSVGGGGSFATVEEVEQPQTLEKGLEEVLKAEGRSAGGRRLADSGPC